MRHLLANPTHRVVLNCISDPANATALDDVALAKLLPSNPARAYSLLRDRVQRCAYQCGLWSVVRTLDRNNCSANGTAAVVAEIRRGAAVKMERSGGRVQAWTNAAAVNKQQGNDDVDGEPNNADFPLRGSNVGSVTESNTPRKGESVGTEPDNRRDLPSERKGETTKRPNLESTDGSAVTNPPKPGVSPNTVSLGNARKPTAKNESNGGLKDSNLGGETQTTKVVGGRTVDEKGKDGVDEADGSASSAPRQRRPDRIAAVPKHPDAETGSQKRRDVSPRGVEGKRDQAETGGEGRLQSREEARLTAQAKAGARDEAAGRGADEEDEGGDGEDGDGEDDDDSTASGDDGDDDES
jgi:hypothetical protein